ncbi:hypothetical protein GE09DRAFT_1085409 [Coniochaeta sp. 2T2.1]|nr:hypothetical protein GE09DRAFT_1085409 [Coniochaeta sp. 2T2.1]
MKTATFVASILSLAVAATAAPAVEARNGSPYCSPGAKQVCCNGLLNCAVQVLSSTCNGDAYCCHTDAPEKAFVNVALLNCVAIL